MYFTTISNNLGYTYKTCWSDIKETCSAVVVGRTTNVDEEECKQFCHKNDNCNFVFFLTNKNDVKECLMYETCDEKRHTINVGSTYGKYACPGKLSFAIEKIISNIHVILFVYFSCYIVIRLFC